MFSVLQKKLQQNQAGRCETVILSAGFSNDYTDQSFSSTGQEKLNIVTNDNKKMKGLAFIQGMYTTCCLISEI